MRNGRANDKLQMPIKAIHEVFLGIKRETNKTENSKKAALKGLPESSNYKTPLEIFIYM